MPRYIHFIDFPKVLWVLGGRVTKPFDIVIVLKSTQEVYDAGGMYWGWEAHQPLDDDRYILKSVPLITLSEQKETLTLDELEWYVKDEDGRVSQEMQDYIVKEPPVINTLQL